MVILREMPKNAATFVILVWYVVQIGFVGNETMFLIVSSAYVIKTQKQSRALS